LFAIFFTGLYFFQEKIIFLNGKRVQIDYLFEFSDDFEEVFLKTSDGNVINALHFKLHKPKGVLLFCQGNTGHLKK
jgi:hypothetical protein